ncbi:hypothetical protein B0H13DRAFT_1911688 [Mycena leptocephala]|nr:hypothetical protein B0H13DRAFT_1911688 [Mycena leptocephala]
MRLLFPVSIDSISRNLKLYATLNISGRCIDHLFPDIICCARFPSPLFYGRYPARIGQNLKCARHTVHVSLCLGAVLVYVPVWSGIHFLLSDAIKRSHFHSPFAHLPLCTSHRHVSPITNHYGWRGRGPSRNLANVNSSLGGGNGGKATRTTTFENDEKSDIGSDIGVFPSIILDIVPQVRYKLQQHIKSNTVANGWAWTGVPFTNRVSGPELYLVSLSTVTSTVSIVTGVAPSTSSTAATVSPEPQQTLIHRHALPTGTIVGVSLAVVAAVVALIALPLWRRRRRTRLDSYAASLVVSPFVRPTSGTDASDARLRYGERELRTAGAQTAEAGTGTEKQRSPAENGTPQANGRAASENTRSGGSEVQRVGAGFSADAPPGYAA